MQTLSNTSRKVLKVMDEYIKAMETGDREDELMEFCDAAATLVMNAGTRAMGRLLGVMGKEGTIGGPVD